MLLKTTRSVACMAAFLLAFGGSALAATAGAAPPNANPYGIASLWQQSDWVARVVLLLLAIMSMASWYVIATKWLEQQGLRSAGKAARLAQTQAGTFAPSAADSTSALPAGNAFADIAQAGIQAHRGYARVHKRISLDDWLLSAIERAVEQAQRRLQSGLAVLATVGSTAPFVGLFGTVWGIYHALTEIGVAGQASIDKVAGPVGEALIMTAIGLAVAVPAVLGYNWLVRRNKVITDELRDFGAAAHAALLGEE